MGSAARTVVASTALAAVLSAIYLIWSPESQDLAAAVFRTDLFEEHGFLLWNNQWYSGHHLLSYSVIYQPLAALFGVRLAGVLAVVAAAALFAALITRRFDGARALVPSLWFAAALAAWLLTGRMPFLVAVPFGLAALLVRQGPFAFALAALATLASPVAGLFTGIAGAALFLAGERSRGTWIALGAGPPILVLNAAFPVGGVEPFVFSAFIAIPLVVLAVLWLVPGEYRAVRIGAVLYGLVGLAAFVIDTPLGGNVTRLGALVAGPLLAALVWPRGRWMVLALAVPLLYWQLVAPVRDVRKASGDASTERAFYEPLLAELEDLAGDGSARIHVPPTKNRWEAAYVAPRYPLARGWLRQLESDDFDLFTDGSLDADSYREWLDEHAVSYVAVPDAPRDYLAEDEVELIDAGLDYLDPVWEGDRWRVFRVTEGEGLGASGITELAADRVVVEADEPGVRSLPVNWTRFWRVRDGDACVREGDDGMVELEVRAAGRVELETSLGGDSCSE